MSVSPPSKSLDQGEVLQAPNISKKWKNYITSRDLYLIVNTFETTEIISFI